MKAHTWPVSLLVVLSLLLTGCQIEEHITHLPDGRWHQEMNLTLSDEEVRTWGGQEAVDQTFSWFEEMAATSGETFQWQKEPVVGGVRYRIVAETAASPDNLPFPYGEWDARLEITLDGRWQVQESVTLTSAELQAAGGEAVVDQAFEQICAGSINLTVTSCDWEKEAVPGGVRYTIVAGGSGWDPSDWLPSEPEPEPPPDNTPLPPPTDTPFPPPTDTPLPTPTDTPLPPPEISSWLEEKRRLIPSLESVDIPTSLFTVPGVSAYDESAARELLDRVNSQMEQGTLTPEQAEAFARLTLQERALARMLPSYTGVAASVADTTIDSAETILGTLSALRPAWNLCRSQLPFCDRLQESTERTVWRLLRDGGKLLARFLGPEPDQRETGAKAWDLGVRLIQDRFAQGHSLQDLLVDNGIQAAMTGMMIRPYLTRTQALLGRGVATADLGSSTANRWPITGSTERAGLLINELVQQAEWQEQEAVERHHDFQQAANLAQVVEDIADLATPSPLAQAVGIGARLEHLFMANLPVLLMNSRNLGCVEYLSTRAAEMAFDSAQPGEDCRSMQGKMPPSDGQVFFVAYRPASANSRLRSELHSQADQYRQALEALVQAVQSGNSQAIEQAVEQLSQAEGAVGNYLQAIQAILLEQGEPDQNDRALIEQSWSWTMSNFVLYLTVAETLMARQSDAQPQTDLQQAAQMALTSVDRVQQRADQVDLTLPAGVPVLVIQELGVETTPDRHLHLNVRVNNTGTGEAVEVTVGVLVEEREVASTALGSIPVGEGKQTTLDIPWPTAPAFTVQAWAGGVLMDSYLAGVPASIAPLSQPGPAPAFARPQGDTTSLLVGFLLLLLVIGGGGALLLSQSRRAQSPLAGLQVVQGQAVRPYVSLRSRQLTIGRDPRCDLALPDRRVSAHHALVQQTPTGYLLTDLGSTNGTFVNGQRITQHLLREGDRICVGTTEIVFRAKEVPAGRPAPSAPRHRTGRR